MHTNALPLQDTDLDLVTTAIELYYLRGLTDQTVPLDHLRRMHDLSEELWLAQAKNEVQGPVYPTAAERMRHERAKAA